MFCFFNDDTLLDFWMNKIGEVFFDLTYESLGLDASKVDLVYYEGLSSKPEFYDFGQDKSIEIKERVVTQTQTGTDNDGNPIYEEVTTHNTVQVIEPDFYVTKGSKLKTC
jgi:hypothetical protein